MVSMEDICSFGESVEVGIFDDVSPLIYFERYMAMEIIEIEECSL